MSNNSQLSRECLSAIESNENDVFAKLDLSDISISQIITLLAQYQSISENDDDDIADAWLDNLSIQDREVLKAFEIARGRFEQGH